MYSVNVFSQYKLPYETLKDLSTEEQASIDRALRGGDWLKDASGNWLSPVKPLLLPKANEPGLSYDLLFPWPDSATLELAQRAARPQLLACEVLGISQRADLNLHLHGVVADAKGQPLQVFEPVPFPVVSEVRRQLQAAIGQTGAHTPAYRLVLAGDTIRALEFQMLVRRRDSRIHKVKTADIFDVRLERTGVRTRIFIVRRATRGEDGILTSLGEPGMSRMILHALDGAPATPFGVLDGKSPSSPSSAAQSWLRKLTTVEAPPVKKPKPPRKPKPEEPQGQPPISELDPQPVEPPPLPEPEPEPKLPQVQDPWEVLPTRMAVSAQVVELSRKTLERRRPLLLTGAPGVGKTMLATLLAEACCGEGNYTLVTADARWTSTEVLGGLRVLPGNTLRYAFMPGVVTRAVESHRQSMASSGKPHALIIDEFNRAHQDEAFGRLLTVLDSQYRHQLPLVDANDGASEKVFLPHDFLLIGTMNDADSARLHELSAALQRRFMSVEVTTPHSERAYLTGKYPGIPAQVFEQLYTMVGRGDGQASEQVQLRECLPLGTHFMTEVLEYVQTGMTLDEVLSALLRVKLSELTRSDLLKLAELAAKLELFILSAELDRCGVAAVF